MASEVSRGRRKAAKRRIADSDEESGPSPTTTTSANTASLFDDSVRASASQEGGHERPVKRAKVAVDEDYRDAYSDGGSMAEADGDNDEFAPAAEEASKSKKGKGAKARAAKTKTSKAAPKEKEIFIRDERKTATPTDTRPIKKHGINIPQPDSNPDSSTSQPQSPAPTAPVPARKKLPTIKKYSQSTPNQTPQAANRTTTKDPTKPPPPTTIRQTPDKRTADVDLANPAVYLELMRSSATGGSRAGSSRREKEAARQQELDRLRQEAHERRRAEAQQNKFDLQRQLEEISLFEEQLAARSLELYPNYLGARWKIDYEKEMRRRQLEEEEAAKEEGEM